MKLKVLLFEFWPCDEEEDEKIISPWRNDSVALEKLLQQPRDPNAEGSRGSRPLHYAANHVESSRLLIEARAEIDKFGRNKGVPDKRKPIACSN